MKENSVLGSMHPKFKKLLKLEAASNGMSIVEYQKHITNKDNNKIEDVVQEWKTKWGSKTKKNKIRGFDFP